MLPCADLETTCSVSQSRIPKKKMSVGFSGSVLKRTVPYSAPALTVNKSTHGYVKTHLVPPKMPSLNIIPLHPKGGCVLNRRVQLQITYLIIYQILEHLLYTKWEIRKCLRQAP